MIGNADDPTSAYFFAIPNIAPVKFALQDAQNLHVDDAHATFQFAQIPIKSPLGGIFNVANVLGAASAARVLGVPPQAIAEGIAHTAVIEGRMERVEAGQPFPVIVDYAHTPDSLEAIYNTFREYQTVCVLGNTGGGRDKWKRPVMGAIAETHCDNIILTDEDPYDEDPQEILEEIAKGIKDKKPEIILDRRTAIGRALLLAKGMEKPAVLITGKGTDPYIMGPNGTKTPWDDRTVAKEEIKKCFPS
jgi:UDP-N-acetylmuramoyl-L-alanyl-D-glutamate--2,6-diaminopimelate ligase